MMARVLKTSTTGKSRAIRTSTRTMILTQKKTINSFPTPGVAV